MSGFAPLNEPAKKSTTYQRAGGSSDRRVRRSTEPLPWHDPLS